jgi:DNA sulfur modification protein DndD
LAQAIIRRDRLKEEINANKARFNSLLELAPFAMLAAQMKKVKEQLMKEEKQQNVNLINSLLKEKYVALKEALSVTIKDAKSFDEILKTHLLSDVQEDAKPLLDYTPSQRSQFNDVFENINNNYNKLFKSILAESRKLQSTNYIEQNNINDY